MPPASAATALQSEIVGRNTPPEHPNPRVGQTVAIPTEEETPPFDVQHRHGEIDRHGPDGEEETHARRRSIASVSDALDDRGCDEDDGKELQRRGGNETRNPPALSAALKGQHRQCGDADGRHVPLVPGVEEESGRGREKPDVGAVHVLQRPNCE